jgi:hypothetical protein
MHKSRLGTIVIDAQVKRLETLGARRLAQSGANVWP